jgi:DNA-binding NarL/FixJ family response regulator
VPILIVEDNRHMRRMLTEILRPAFTTTPIFEAADARSAIALVHEIRPDLVLMDVALPDGNGISLTSEITSLFPATRVVIVSGHCTRACQDAAHAAGAAGYVFKDEVYASLLPTLARVVVMQ